MYDAPFDVVLSPATAGRDWTYKRTLTRCGVREYWLVDPMEGTVEALTLGERGSSGQGTGRSPLLQGLRIDLQEIF
ncbi:MAG: Uma2 family endonuclease [Chloroflexota bacterium]|nr:Uma2 family endonuclease [Chloroflexota bacterium]